MSGQRNQEGEDILYILYRGTHTLNTQTVHKIEYSLQKVSFKPCYYTYKKKVILTKIIHLQAYTHSHTPKITTRLKDLLQCIKYQS